MLHDDFHKLLTGKIVPPITHHFKNYEIGVLWVSLGRNLYLAVASQWKE
jgi:hypothetical protein